MKRITNDGKNQTKEKTAKKVLLAVEGLQSYVQMNLGKARGRQVTLEVQKRPLLMKNLRQVLQKIGKGVLNCIEGRNQLQSD